jgi:hypothetical protein
LVEQNIEAIPVISSNLISSIKFTKLMMERVDTSSLSLLDFYNFIGSKGIYLIN